MYTNHPDHLWPVKIDGMDTDFIQLPQYIVLPVTRTIVKATYYTGQRVFQAIITPVGRRLFEDGLRPPTELCGHYKMGKIKKVQADEFLYWEDKKCWTHIVSQDKDYLLVIYKDDFWPFK